MSILQKSNKISSSRHQIDLIGAKDDILQLSKKEYRMILEVSPINFELRSEEEQDALIETFEGFLNSMSTPLQFIVKIRELDMDKYIADLHERLGNEETDIYKQQIENYSEFIQDLVKSNKILSRHFYVVVPYTDHDKSDFEFIKNQLLVTVDMVTKGLLRLGMQSRKLDSIELLDQFYSYYNPHRAKFQPIKDQAINIIRDSYIRRNQ